MRPQLIRFVVAGLLVIAVLVAITLALPVEAWRKGEPAGPPLEAKTGTGYSDNGSAGQGPDPRFPHATAKTSEGTIDPAPSSRLPDHAFHGDRSTGKADLFFCTMGSDQGAAVTEKE